MVGTDQDGRQAFTNPIWVKISDDAGAIEVLVRNQAGVPIHGATVSVGEQEKRTDGSGKATFHSIPSGSVTVDVSANGYQSNSVVVTVSSGTTVGVVIELSPAPDISPPETTLTRSPTAPNGCNYWYTSDVGICLIASDDYSGVAYTEYNLNGTGWYGYASCFIMTSEATNSLLYRSMDNNGNLEQTKSATIKIDKTPPATTAALIPATPNGCNGWYISPVQITLNATDATSGVQNTVYRIDGGAWQDYGGPFMMDQECEHDVYFKSQDNACNWESEKSIHVKLDMTPPTSSVALDPPTPNGCNDYYITPVTFTVTSVDSCSGVQQIQYKIDDGPWQVYTGPVVIDYECEHDFYYKAQDNACNWEDAKSVHVKIDLYPPVITVNSPQATTYTHADVITVDYNVTDSCSGVKWHEAWFKFKDSCDCDRQDILQQVQNGQQVEVFWMGLEPPKTWFWVDAEDYACWKSHKDVYFDVIATIDSMFFCTNKCRELNWITVDGIRNSLIDKLTEAKKNYEIGNKKTVRNILRAYIHEVEKGLTFQQINMKGYCHLVQDAQYVINSLGEVDKPKK